MPSLKMTPFSGISERTQSRSDFELAVDQVAFEVRLGNGSRTANRNCVAVPWQRHVRRARVALPKAPAIASEPVTMLLNHAVEPSPVETMSPLDDCFSLILADGDFIERRGVGARTDEEVVDRMEHLAVVQRGLRHGHAP